MKRRCFLLLSILCVAAVPAALFSASASFGQGTAPTDFSKATTSEKLSQLDQRVTAAQSSADNAWMLVSAALVLMMTGPGLALFYGGLVRRKNTLAIMMQSFALMALITVMWALVGDRSICAASDQSDFRRGKSGGRIGWALGASWKSTGGRADRVGNRAGGNDCVAENR